LAQDSSKPDFWESRYRDGVIPWDAGKVPEALHRYLPTLQAGARVLVPGCGSAYEARYLAENGLDVVAIDFSPAAVDLAKRNLGRFSGIARLADFFEFDPGTSFDLIYERAFLCALPRRMWSAYAERCERLLSPSGAIAGFFFFAETPKGPPFGTTQAELDTLFAGRFERIEDSPAQDSIEVFSGKERWQVWRRKP
jgi:SAM-dependent methyltransferase